MKKIILFILIFISSALISTAQDQTHDKIKVFLDCNTTCDENYIKTEINVVDFVIDRLVADVHILITSRENGSGGKSYQLIFYGQNLFRSHLDTLTFSSSVNSTDVEIRMETVKRIKIGLIPYLINSSFFNSVDITMKDSKYDKNNLSTVTTKDKWNYWVYKIAIDDEYNVDEVYKNDKLSGNLSANRTTATSRMNFLINGNYSNSSYHYDSSSNNISYNVIIINSNYEISHYLVTAISHNWSFRYDLGFSNSTFSNIKSKILISSGIEYAIFPYSESNSKFFAINYSLDIRRNNYYNTTIFDKTSETLLGQKAEINLSLKQIWGFVNTSITYRNFLKDWNLNNLSTNLNVDIRVTGGLFFYVYFNGAVEHDQIYLEKGDATLEEILTKRRQLESSYKIYSGIGLSFRFGSILNNFVNPRFSKY